ncbi:hypothetical protein K435DRAFT_837793 [Dendrothele bispora CBS 962.96]|uniref:Fungal-type protein kinase domain-containing protein n=1 Tax=Dendrothele bispora (strain CBS 962.96) TaxID=1314807 RepID=A0A4S8MAZ9_DENBC|nr:hypothetical protein K435DRAFT_837793 [Dendrothele bispora CBS 962.96]
MPLHPESSLFTAQGSNRLQRADTLVKSSMTIDSLSKIDTLRITTAVEHDLRDNTSLATRQSFLDNFFPVDNEKVEKVFTKLKDQKVYGKRWNKFPVKPGGPEADYYRIIQDTLQKIQDTYCAETQTPVQRVWVDTHSTAPESFTETAANRPDLAHAIGSKTEWDNRNKELLRSNLTTTTRTQTKNAQTIANNEIPQDFRKNLRVYWFRTSTVVEVKPVNTPLNSEEAYNTVQQLAGYMRQILREQLDRRFVFGLIFFHDCLSVWYCDRSGLLGIDEVLNIHEEPEAFIRVIASLSTKSYEDLGWDPTMRFFQMDKPHQYSYELDFSKDEIVQYFQNSDRQYSTKWVIKINGKEYVTIRALSLSRAEIMCGRGQLVWLAVDVEKRELVVIKQSWSPYTLTNKNQGSDDGDHGSQSNADLYGKSEMDKLRSEAEVYLHALGKHELLQERKISELIPGHEVPEQLHKHDYHIGRLRAHEIVPDTRTGENFRCGIKESQAAMAAQPPPTSGKRKAPGDEHAKGGPQEEQLHEQLTNMMSVKFGNHSFRFTERQLCRMVFEDFGWPIKRFRSLGELLNMLEHCLEGYRFLLMQGIVHRDISPSNMLICPILPLNPTMPAKVAGRLNDLDHSKVDVRYECAALENTIEQQDLDQTMHILSPTLKLMKIPGCSLELYQILVGLKFKFNMIYTYLDIVLPTLPRLNMLPAADQVLKPDTLGLGVKPTDCIPPMFTDRVQENEERSGTVPYMSHEFLARQINPPPHTAVHDMESIFWVLLYLCLTREGPGGKLRAALRNDSATQVAGSPDAKIGHLVYCFFDAEQPVLDLNKKQLFKTPSSFEAHVIPSIHPYFEPLIPLLKEWFRILCVAFFDPRLLKSPEYIWPHLGFQLALTRICEESVRKLDKDPLYEAMTEEEDNRRTEYMHEILEALDKVSQGVTHSSDATIPELDPSPRARQLGSRNSNIFTQFGQAAEPLTPLVSSQDNKRQRR